MALVSHHQLPLAAELRQQKLVQLSVLSLNIELPYCSPNIKNQAIEFRIE